jgi:hypothetical protein
METHMDDLIKRMDNYNDSLAPPMAKGIILDAKRALAAANARISDLETKCRLYEASLDKADTERDALAQDAARWRYAVKYWLDEHIATKQADEALSKQKDPK